MTHIKKFCKVCGERYPIEVMFCKNCGSFLVNMKSVSNINYETEIKEKQENEVIEKKKKERINNQREETIKKNRERINNQKESDKKRQEAIVNNIKKLKEEKIKKENLSKYFKNTNIRRISRNKSGCGN